MIKYNNVLDYLDELFSNPRCELNYNCDYELLIAVVLSAQCSDKRVNIVTKELFKKYDLVGLSNASIEDIKKIIYSVGTSNKKARYIKNIANELITKCNGVVPNNREFLENLDGVGRKTCNVVLAILFNEATIAVDTHVARVAKRLGITKNTDAVKIEKDLMKFFPKDKWSRVHLQLVLFGRYYCKSINPLCDNCKFNNICKYKKNTFFD